MIRIIRGWVTSVLIAGIGISSCNISNTSVVYEKHAVAKDTFSVYLYCHGQLTPLLSKQFKCEKKGNIHYSIPLDESIEYSKGTTIASITPFGDELIDAKAELYSQQKELALLKKELSLQEQLFNKGQISKNELERNRISLSRKRMEVQKSNIKKSTQHISAPFKGHLSLVGSPDGSEVSEGTNLFTWVDWGTIRVKMNIPDYHLRRISSGKPVIVEGYVLKRPITCKVATIISNPSDNFGMNASPGTAGSNSMTSAYLSIDSEELAAVSFPQGEVVCKYVDTVLTDVLCVPVSFLLFRGEHAYLKKTNAKLTLVQLGIVSDSLAEITAGVAENDTIIRSVPLNDEFRQ